MWMPPFMSATITYSVEILTGCIIIVRQMTGLRESKKRRTREAIAQAAADLFHERGFGAVTVDDVARAADVSRQTVFNYFPTKEQMLFDREDEVSAALLALVRGRRDGASLLAA